MRYVAALVLAAGLLLVASAGSAETVEKAVKANMRSVVGGIFPYWIHECKQSEIPDAKVGEAPKNGSVAVEMRRVTLGKETTCPGVNVSGPVFIYTPNKGFKGVDEFTIDFPFARAESRPPTVRSIYYRLTVQ